MAKRGDPQSIWEHVTKLLEMVKSTNKSGDKLKNDHPKNMFKIPCKGGHSCCQLKNKGSMKATCRNNGGVVNKEGLVLNHVVVEDQGVELGTSRAYMVQSWYNEPIFA